MLLPEVPSAGEKQTALLPGTVLAFSQEDKDRAFEVLQPIFVVSGGGLSLSQVTELTGLLPTTVQNWIKRGWVEPPVNKRYSQNQVARILLINLLRPAMKLEKITALLGYINGRVDDRRDDILPDAQLYSLLCAALWRLRERPSWPEEQLAAEMVRAQQLSDSAAEKLHRALTVMLLSVAAADRMNRAEQLYASLNAGI